MAMYNYYPEPDSDGSSKFELFNITQEHERIVDKSVNLENEYGIAAEKCCPGLENSYITREPIELVHTTGEDAKAISFAIEKYSNATIDAFTTLINKGTEFNEGKAGFRIIRSTLSDLYWKKRIFESCMLGRDSQTRPGSVFTL
ncbi:unnamed protein product [Mucor hiemalis]